MSPAEGELGSGMPQREEESLIDAMREAIRGDRERAAARGAVVSALEHAPPAAEPEPEPEPAVEPQQGVFRRLLGR